MFPAINVQVDQASIMQVLTISVKTAIPASELFFYSFFCVLHAYHKNHFANLDVIVTDCQIKLVDFFLA